MKECPSCKRTLPAKRFYSNAGKADGLSQLCKPCHDRQNAAAKERYRDRQRIRRAEQAGRNPEMRIRMLGNSGVFVTCTCLDRTRRPWGRRANEMPTEWKSLGDFQVGTPVAELLAAWERHAREAHGDSVGTESPAAPRGGSKTAARKTGTDAWKAR